MHQLQLGEAACSSPGRAESLEASGWGWESSQARARAKHVGLIVVWLPGGGNTAGEESLLCWVLQG